RRRKRLRSQPRGRSLRDVRNVLRILIANPQGRRRVTALGTTAYHSARQMPVDLESRARDVLRRLGSVPGDPSAARALMQARVRICVGFGPLLWVFALPIYTMVPPGARRIEHLVAHAGTTLLSGLLFLLASRKEQSVRVLGAIELVATIAQVFAFVT